jgi:hypothetical protein
LRSEKRTDSDARHSHKRSRGYLRSQPIRAATREVEHLHQLEREGESEWTPWIAIAGLILLFAAIGLLVFGAAEAATHLLASGGLTAG